MTGYVPNSFGQLTRVVCVHTHEGTSRRGNERTRERELHYSEGIRGHLSRMFARSSSSTMTTMCRKFSISF